MPTSSQHNFRIIAFLLVVAVISSAVGNIYSAITQEDLRANQVTEIKEILDHREAVKAHANETSRLLNTTTKTINTIEAALMNASQEDVEQLVHWNKTLSNSEKLDKLLNQFNNTNVTDSGGQ